MPDTRAPTVPQFTRRLGIETPEHLVLELELAGLGSRMAATVCDAGLLVLAFVLLGVGIQLLPTPTGGDAEGPWSTLAAIVLILTVFLLFWGYFLLFEALNDGRTPGKRLMGIRVVMDTGHPLTLPLPPSAISCASWTCSPSSPSRSDSPLCCSTRRTNGSATSWPAPWWSAIAPRD